MYVKRKQTAIPCAIFYYFMQIYGISSTLCTLSLKFACMSWLGNQFVIFFPVEIGLCSKHTNYK